MSNQDPRTPEQWQEAVDYAKGALALEDARAYGLVTGGPKVYVELARELIRRGAAMGIHPRPEAIEAFVAALRAGGHG